MQCMCAGVGSGSAGVRNPKKKCEDEDRKMTILPLKNREKLAYEFHIYQKNMKRNFDNFSIFT